MKVLKRESSIELSKLSSVIGLCALMLRLPTFAQSKKFMMSEKKTRGRKKKGSDPIEATDGVCCQSMEASIEMMLKNGDPSLLSLCYLPIFCLKQSLFFQERELNYKVRSTHWRSATLFHASHRIASWMSSGLCVKHQSHLSDMS